MATRNAAGLTLALFAFGSLSAAIGRQGAEATAASAVERATRYVDAYQQTFSAMVSEEHQIQRIVRHDGRVKETRELKSDFLLVKLGPGWPVVFRDVLEVDRKPVRNREDRLRKLFLEKPKTAAEQARAISQESQRHNIGLSRTGNSPFLPLIDLSPTVAPRSRFTLAGSTLAFEEVQSPSVMGRTSGRERHDVFARGSFEIDLTSGRVLAAEITGAGAPGHYSITLITKYRNDPQLELMVPVDVQERYWRHDKPNEDHLEASATYSNFRRFQVNVTEQIKLP